MEVSRGLLIVFEGLDRSGKSTQSKLLHEHISKSNRQCVLIAFPDRKEPFGQVIDRYLRKEIDLCEKALHLAFSANRWEKAELINDYLRRGIDVICDRYAFSGVAYSIAKGMDSHWVRQSDIGLPRPDVVLFFEVSPEVARQRGGFGDERLENDELQIKVNQAMRSLKKAYWQSVNANKSQAEVHQDIVEIYDSLNRECALKTIDEI